MEKKHGLVALCLLLLLVACGPTDNYGYPSKINFGKEGGTKICSGKEGFYDITIDGLQWIWRNKSLVRGENDTIIATYYWLTVKYKRSFNNDMKIIAEPNTTGKKRTLYVNCMVDNSGATIKVIQSK